MKCAITVFLSIDDKEVNDKQINEETNLSTLKTLTFEFKSSKILYSSRTQRKSELVFGSRLEAKVEPLVDWLFVVMQLTLRLVCKAYTHNMSCQFPQIAFGPTQKLLAFQSKNYDPSMNYVIFAS